MTADSGFLSPGVYAFGSPRLRGIQLCVFSHNALPRILAERSVPHLTDHDLRQMDEAWLQSLPGAVARSVLLRVERHRDDPHENLRAVVREFLLDREAILRPLSDSALPLTNNEAERALRHSVIARRISQGVRSEPGSRACALSASVIETCRRRGAVVLEFIGAVIAAARKGLALPALPPIQAGTP